MEIDDVLIGQLLEDLLGRLAPSEHNAVVINDLLAWKQHSPEIFTAACRGLAGAPKELDPLAYLLVGEMPFHIQRVLPGAPWSDLFRFCKIRIHQQRDENLARLLTLLMQAEPLTTGSALRLVMEAYQLSTTLHKDAVVTLLLTMSAQPPQDREEAIAQYMASQGVPAYLVLELFRLCDMVRRRAPFAEREVAETIAESETIVTEEWHEGEPLVIEESIPSLPLLKVESGDASEVSEETVDLPDLDTESEEPIAAIKTASLAVVLRPMEEYIQGFKALYEQKGTSAYAVYKPQKVAKNTGISTENISRIFNGEAPVKPLSDIQVRGLARFMLGDGEQLDVFMSDPLGCVQ